MFIWDQCEERCLGALDKHVSKLLSITVQTEWPEISSLLWFLSENAPTEKQSWTELRKQSMTKKYKCQNFVRRKKERVARKVSDQKNHDWKSERNRRMDIFKSKVLIKLNLWPKQEIWTFFFVIFLGLSDGSVCTWLASKQSPIAQFF